MISRSRTSIASLAMAMALGACNDTSFTSTAPKLGRTGSLDGGQSTGGSTGGNTSGNSTGSDPGRENDGSTGELPVVPLRVIYQAGDSVDTIGYSGSFIFKVERDGAAGTSTELLNTPSFGNGSTNAFQTKDIPNLCYCGAKNAFKMTINANGEQDVASWKSQNMAMLTRNVSGITGADDIRKWMQGRLGSNFNYGQHTILFGGFDHDWSIFGGNNSTWSSEGGWNDNDDFKAIFTCLVNQCPDGGAGTSLEFVGTGI